jgi:hypothetical protein
MLGVITVEIGSDREATRFLSALASGHPERFRGFDAWSTPVFEVGSGGPVDVGLDGETLALDPPLRFTIRPGAVRVRLPALAIGYSPSARALEPRTAAISLWRTALGRPAPALLQGGGGPSGSGDPTGSTAEHDAARPPVPRTDTADGR